MLRGYLPCALILDVLDPQRAPHVHQNPQGSFGLSVFRAVPGDSSGVHRDLVVWTSHNHAKSLTALRVSLLLLLRDFQNQWK